MVRKRSRQDSGSSDASTPEVELGHRPVVLVVGDDRDRADTYASWLGGSCEVRTGHSENEALAELTSDTDVVLIDQLGPNLWGGEVLNRARSDGFDCQVALMADDEPNVDVAKTVCDDYLTKPASKTEVLAMIQRLLSGERDGGAVEDRQGPDSATDRAIGDGGTGAVQDQVTPVTPATRVHEAPSPASPVRRAGTDDGSQSEQLERVNDLVRSVNTAILGADSSQALGDGLCRELTDDGPYENAVFAETVGDLDQIVPSGHTFGDVALDPLDCPPDGPIGRALADGEIALVTQPAMADGAVGRLHGALPDGRQHDAAIVVPVGHRGQVRGLLLLFVDGVAELDPTEEEALHEVGEVIWNAFRSLETRELVDTDSVVELEFEVSDRSDPFVALSAEHACRVQVEGIHLKPDGDTVCFFTVSGTTAEEARGFLENRGGVDDCRPVSEDCSDLLHCSLSGASIMAELLDTTAAVNEFDIEDGVGFVDVSVAPRTDLRSLLKALRDEFQNIELVSKTLSEGRYQSVGRFRGSLDSELTERQDDVLGAAHRAGYFDWPRESNAEDVADALGLAAPTLHEHLREAERKLVDTYLAETEPTESLAEE